MSVILFELGKIRRWSHSCERLTYQLYSC